MKVQKQERRREEARESAVRAAQFAKDTVAAFQPFTQRSRNSNLSIAWQIILPRITLKLCLVSPDHSQQSAKLLLQQCLWADKIQTKLFETNLDTGALMEGDPPVKVFANHSSCMQEDQEEIVFTRVAVQRLAALGMTCHEMCHLVSSHAMPVLANWVQEKGWEGLSKFCCPSGKLQPLWERVLTDPKACLVSELKVKEICQPDSMICHRAKATENFGAPLAYRRALDLIERNRGVAYA